MNIQELVILLEGYKPVKVGENQIYYDKSTDVFIVELFEFVNAKGENWFSIDDGYEHIEDAIRAAKTKRAT